MADDQQPAKKVVKRVVKKTVVRPPSDREPAKTVRYGRAVSTATRPQPKAKASPRPAPRAPARPRVDVGAKVAAAGRAVTSRGSRAASGVAGAASSASRATGTFVADRFRAVRAWRIPHIDPLPASLITGIVVGLVSVGLGVVALSVFSELRGVSSGGGRWGSLAFVVVAFVAFALGDLLLSAFGSAQARLVSFLGVVLTIVAMLGLFLDLADTVWALVVVPALGAVTYAAAHWLIDLAERAPTLPE